MNTSLFGFMKISTVCTALLTATASFAAEMGPYMNVDIGPNIVQDVDVEIGGVLSGTSELDPGVRLGIAGGYNFNRYFGLELESGFLANEFEEDDDSWLGQVPFLVNGIFRFDNPSRVIPYLGVGAGGVASMLGIEEGIVDDEDGDFVFGWQAILGLRFRINDNMAIGVQYKYLGVDSPEFDIEGVDVELDNVHNHTISAAFNFQF